VLCHTRAERYDDEAAIERTRRLWAVASTPGGGRFSALRARTHASCAHHTRRPRLYAQP
jgi:hypothetical protein